MPARTRPPSCEKNAMPLHAYPWEHDMCQRATPPSDEVAEAAGPFSARLLKSEGSSHAGTIIREILRASGHERTAVTPIIPVAPITAASRVPSFWPVAAAAAMAEHGAELSTKFLRVAEEQIKIHVIPPKPATPNTVRLDLRTVIVRDYGKPGGLPTLVDAPYAGHPAVTRTIPRTRAWFRRCSTMVSAMSS